MSDQIRLGFLTLSLLLFLSAVAPSVCQAQETPDVLAEYVREFMEQYESSDTVATVQFYRRCNSSPQDAIAAVKPFLNSPAAKVRRLALECIATYDRHESLQAAVSALDEPMDLALTLLKSAAWDESNKELRVLARTKIRALVVRGDVQAAEVLGYIGIAEDIPALRSALALAVSRELPLTPVQTALQTEPSLTGKTILPRERIELGFRQALAKLGDGEQLEFFCKRLRGLDHMRAIDALDRARNIARPELSLTIAAFLEDDEVPKSGCGANPSPAKLAVLALSATFPDLAASAPLDGRLKYWRDWASQSEGKAKSEQSDSPWKQPSKGETGQSKSDNQGPSPNSLQNEPAKTPRAPPHQASASEPDHGTHLFAVILGVLTSIAILIMAVVRMRSAHR